MASAGITTSCSQSEWIQVEYIVKNMTEFNETTAWLLSASAKGKVVRNQSGISFGNPTTIRFSDPDTAFAFKMKFG